MTRTPIRSVAICSVLSTMIGIAAPIYAQQTPDTPKPTKPSETANSASTAAAASTNAPAPASADAPAPVQKIVVHEVPARAAATPDVPSEDVLRKARTAGYHTKVAHGIVYYCKSETELGTRFSNEVCLDENQLEQTLLQQQAQRDQLKNHACSGAGCSGK